MERPNADQLGQCYRMFTYHKPFGDQPVRYEELRSRANALAAGIAVLCPNSREKSLALTNLQQAVMWANASIAINEDPEAPEADGQGKET